MAAMAPPASLNVLHLIPSSNYCTCHLHAGPLSENWISWDLNAAAYLSFPHTCKTPPVIDFCLDYAKICGCAHNLMNAMIPAMRAGEQS